MVWLCNTPLAPLNHVLKLQNIPPIMAPWITAFIDVLKKRPEITLHVISYLSTWKRGYKFTHESVNYYLIRRPFPSFLKFLPVYLRLDTLMNQFIRKLIVKRIVGKLKPDIINLFGTEHEICSAFLCLVGNKIVSIQGFITFVYDHTPSLVNRKKLLVENSIFKSTNNFIIQASFMENIIRKINADANFFYCQYPSIPPNIIAENFEKETDILFAARICKDKGIEDLLQALVIVKKALPNIKVRIIGKAEKDYLEQLFTMILNMNLTSNIEYLGYISSFDELYTHMAKSIIYVLPTHHDIIPSSVIECMLIGTPVVSYNVGGLPDLNVDKETCLLVDPGNIECLAEKVIFLYNNPSKQANLTKTAREYTKSRFNNTILSNSLIEIYNKVSEIPPPEEQG